MIGIEFVDRDSAHPPFAVEAMLEMLKRGYILLPSGKGSRVLSLTPPLTIASTQLEGCIQALQEVVSGFHAVETSC